MESLVEFRIDIIAIFAVGALIGIVSFSHVLDWLFKNFEMITKAVAKVVKETIISKGKINFFGRYGQKCTT